MDTQQNTAPYFLHQGTNYSAHEYLGAHREGDRYVFRVWAPGAVSVCLVGDFCGWESGLCMKRVSEGGVWQTSLVASRVRVGDNYKFKIEGENGVRLRADPYAEGYECFPADASVICDKTPYRWKDARWLSHRARDGFGTINAYALDLGAFMRRAEGKYLSYAAIARELCPYVKQMGYTHVLLCDVCEYTQYGEHFEAYGYFAPTARHGAPRDFKAFVDCMHEAGLGVLVSIDFTEFPTYALGCFDGGALYETEGERRQIDLSRAEVECFLASAAHMWLERYHIDGLALYGLTDKDFKSRREYLKVASFFRKVNSYLKASYPGIVLIAQNGNWRAPLVSVEDGGLGFDMVMHTLTGKDSGDFLGGDLQGALMTLGRRSLVGSHVGEYKNKFSMARLTFGQLMCAPCHKLTFSGQEIGQFDNMEKWRQTQWYLLDYDLHARLQRCVAELAALWQSSDALYRGEYKLLDAAEKGVYAYLRHTDDQAAVVIVNTTDKKFEKFSQELPIKGSFKEIFNSDDGRYAGEDGKSTAPARTHAVSAETNKGSIELKLPPLAITILIRV